MVDTTSFLSTQLQPFSYHVLTDWRSASVNEKCLHKSPAVATSRTEATATKTHAIFAAESQHPVRTIHGNIVQMNLQFPGLRLVHDVREAIHLDQVAINALRPGAEIGGRGYNNFEQGLTRGRCRGAQPHYKL